MPADPEEHRTVTRYVGGKAVKWAEAEAVFAAAARTEQVEFRDEAGGVIATTAPGAPLLEREERPGRGTSHQPFARTSLRVTRTTTPCRAPLRDAIDPAASLRRRSFWQMHLFPRPGGGSPETIISARMAVLLDVAGFIRLGIRRMRRAAAKRAARRSGRRSP